MVFVGSSGPFKMNAASVSGRAKLDDSIFSGHIKETQGAGDSNQIENEVIQWTSSQGNFGSIELEFALLLAGDRYFQAHNHGSPPASF
jgi:hypothetical protein